MPLTSGTGLTCNLLVCRNRSSIQLPCWSLLFLRRKGRGRNPSTNLTSLSWMTTRWAMALCSPALLTQPLTAPSPPTRKKLCTRCRIQWEIKGIAAYWCGTSFYFWRLLWLYAYNVHYGGFGCNVNYTFDWKILLTSTWISHTQHDYIKRLIHCHIISIISWQIPKFACVYLFFHGDELLHLTYSVEYCSELLLPLLSCGA